MLHILVDRGFGDVDRPEMTKRRSDGLQVRLKLPRGSAAPQFVIGLQGLQAVYEDIMETLEAFDLYGVTKSFQRWR